MSAPESLKIGAIAYKSRSHAARVMLEGRAAGRNSMSKADIAKISDSGAAISPKLIIFLIISRCFLLIFYITLNVFICSSGRAIHK